MTLRPPKDVTEPTDTATVETDTEDVDPSESAENRGEAEPQSTTVEIDGDEMPVEAAVTYLSERIAALDSEDAECRDAVAEIDEAVGANADRLDRLEPTVSELTEAVEVLSVLTAQTHPDLDEPPVELEGPQWT